MKKARFVLIGYGWRADFFSRLARMMPERFEVSARVLRSQQRANQVQAEEQVPAGCDLDAALKSNPDFAVLCVPRNAVAGYLEQLVEHGVPVLCETPPAASVEECTRLWDFAQNSGLKIQVSEQYIFQPLYMAILRVVQMGLLGPVDMMMLSALHGYHAVSVFRHVLGIKYENCRIHGENFPYQLVRTDGRDGFDHTGELVAGERGIATLAFDNGKTAVFDFSGEQYSSAIRTRRLNIQGQKGEINDFDVRWLNAGNEGVLQQLVRVDRGIYNNNGWYHHGIMLGSEYVYKNPFPGVRLNDDEIAVAECLVRMKHFVQSGEEFYSLKEALQDTYLSFVMDDCIAQGKTAETNTQMWA